MIQPVGVAPWSISLDEGSMSLQEKLDTIRDMSGVVDHYSTLNTLSKGMRIQSDSLPPV